MTGQREGSSCRGCSRRACRAWGRGVEFAPTAFECPLPAWSCPSEVAPRSPGPGGGELTFDPSAGLTLSGSAPRRERSPPREVGPCEVFRCPGRAGSCALRSPPYSLQHPLHAEFINPLCFHGMSGCKPGHPPLSWRVWERKRAVTGEVECCPWRMGQWMDI